MARKGDKSSRDTDGILFSSWIEPRPCASSSQVEKKNARRGWKFPDDTHRTLAASIYERVLIMTSKLNLWRDHERLNWFDFHVVRKHIKVSTYTFHISDLSATNLIWQMCCQTSHFRTKIFIRYWITASSLQDGRWMHLVWSFIELNSAPPRRAA